MTRARSIHKRACISLGLKGPAAKAISVTGPACRITITKRGCIWKIRDVASIGHLRLADDVIAVAGLRQKEGRAIKLMSPRLPVVPEGHAYPEWSMTKLLRAKIAVIASGTRIPPGDRSRYIRG